MTYQSSFSQAEFAAKKKTTRREKFLARMEEVIPWAKLLAVLAPWGAPHDDELTSDDDIVAVDFFVRDDNEDRLEAASIEKLELVQQ